MMLTVTPELSRRLGRALGTHLVTPDERVTVTDDMERTGVAVWGDLSPDVRELVESIESRPLL